MTRRDPRKSCCGSATPQVRASTPGARGPIRRRSMPSSHRSRRVGEGRVAAVPTGIFVLRRGNGGHARSARIVHLTPPASLRRAQAIADAGFGEDILRPLRVGLDLLAQLAPVDAQVLRVGKVAPQLLEQKAMGEHLTGMLYQEAQQFQRELHLPFADFDDCHSSRINFRSFRPVTFLTRPGTFLPGRADSTWNSYG